MGDLELLFKKIKHAKKLNKSIPEANAKIELEVKGADCKTIGKGNTPGLFIAFTSLIEVIREQMEEEGTEKEVINYLLESAFKTEMEDIDE